MKHMDEREVGKKGQGIPDAKEKGIHTHIDKHKKISFKQIQVLQ